jgi:hypothetical protein
MSASFQTVAYRLQWQDYTSWRRLLVDESEPEIHWQDYATLAEAQAAKAELRRHADPDAELVACITPLPPLVPIQSSKLPLQSKRKKARRK